MREKAIKRTKKLIVDMHQAHIDAGNSTLSFPNTNTFPPKTGVTIDMDKVNEEMEKLYKCADCGCDNKHEYFKNHTNLCYSCKAKRKEEAKVKWLNDHRCQHTIEERLRIVEAFMYDHRQVKHSNPFNTLLRG